MSVSASLSLSSLLPFESVLLLQLSTAESDEK